MAAPAGIDLSWEWDAWVVVPLVASILLYGIGVARMWWRAGVGRGVALWQSGAYAAGLIVLIAALLAPLHEYSEHLFSAHMIEHELLMTVAAPLLSLARPLAMFVHAFPRNARLILVRAAGTSLVKTTWQWLMRPLNATIIHGAAIWIWHIPALLDATLVSEAMHRLQHVSFFGTALIFWWAIIRRPATDYGLGALHVFATMVHTSLLGALLTLAPRVFYPVQTADAPLFGLTPLEDQQLAGLIMWVPAGALYLLAGLLLAGMWLGSVKERQLRPAMTTSSVN
jgi:putative membrane protein